MMKLNMPKQAFITSRWLLKVKCLGLVSLITLAGLTSSVYQMAVAVKTPPVKAKNRPVKSSPASKATSQKALANTKPSQPSGSQKPENAQVKPAPAKTLPKELALYRPMDFTGNQLQPISETLDETGFPHRMLAHSDLQNYQGGYLLLPLEKQLEPTELQALEQYVTRGGKVIVLPPEDASHSSIHSLFSLLHLPLGAAGFASQSLDFKWTAKNGKPPAISGSLPVSSQVYTLQTQAAGQPAVQVLAMWGEDFPAVVQSDRGAFFNWPWGHELSSESNVAALANIVGFSPAANQPKEQSVAGADLFASDVLASGEGFSFVDALATEQWTPNQRRTRLSDSQYRRERQVLEDYRLIIDDAVETALLLDIQLPIKQIQQKLLFADIEMTKYENQALSGEFAQARRSYSQARQLLNDALVLTSASPRIEGRAIWLDRGTIVGSGSPQGLKKVLEKLHKAGINVVYFETVNAGYPVYPSKLTPQNPMIEGWDPLETAVKEGHKLGMEVHAWVWCFAVGNRRHNPIVGKPLDYAGPVLEDDQLMSEALRGSGGNLLPGGRQYEYWLSPASPKGRQFLIDLYSEIVSNYDVDGLQLDYIRYPFQKPGNYMGYEPVGRQRFSQSTGLSIEGNERVWVAWKTYQVSSFVKETSEKLRSLKPDLKLSAAVFPMPRASRIVAIQQDWETWIENGWIDTLSPMSYTTSPSALQKIYESVEFSPKRRSLIYPGIAIHKIDAQDLLKQVDAIREKGALGSTLFAMAHLDDSKVTALSDGPYKEKSVVSPHKDPLQATLTIINDYRDKFALLLKNQELSEVSAEQLAAIQDNLAAFQHAVEALKASQSQGNGQGGSSPESLAIAKTRLSHLNGETHRWLAHQKKLHPYRAQYFQGLVLRLEQMLAYLNDNYRPKTEPTAQADDGFKFQ